MAESMAGIAAPCRWAHRKGASLRSRLLRRRPCPAPARSRRTGAGAEKTRAATSASPTPPQDPVEGMQSKSCRSLVATG